MSRLTNLSDQELRVYLSRFRTIAQMDDDDALHEVFELSLAIHRDASMAPEGAIEASRRRNIDIDTAIRELEAYRQELRHYRQDVQNGKPGYLSAMFEPEPWEPEEFGDDWPESVREALRPQLQDVIRETHELCEQELILWYRGVIQEEARRRKIYNISTVRSILAHLSEAEEEVAKRGALTNLLRQDIHYGRERCAWFRAKKRLSEIQVAQDSGNIAQAARIRKEAESVLRQDWREAFPDQPYPSIHDVPT